MFPVLLISVLPSHRCVGFNACLSAHSQQPGHMRRGAAHEDICVSLVNLFKGTRVFDMLWNSPPSPLRSWYVSGDLTTTHIRLLHVCHQKCPKLHHGNLRSIISLILIQFELVKKHRVTLTWNSTTGDLWHSSQVKRSHNIHSPTWSTAVFAYLIW